MKYKVLYRKYRPDSFDSLVGQDYIKEILKNSIKSNKISHAYIFSGPRGTGKTSTAKIFAKTINCLNPKDGEACCVCDICKSFESNTDIIEIDAASNNGVDQIREITNNIKLSPSMSKYKVYIIDEVHMLSTSAFNALLLTLEEPPAHVIFILATTNIENVPITILSRCQRFDFRKIDTNDIKNRLIDICSKEKIDIDEDALDEICYISDGGLRDALSILDQLSKSDKKIVLEDVSKEIGTVSYKNIVKLMDYIEKNDANGVINTINNYRMNALDYKIIIKKIIDCATNRAKNIVLDGKIDRLDYDDYKRLVFELTDCLNIININIDAYSMIELVLLRFIKLSTQNIVVEEEKKVEKKKEEKAIVVSGDYINIRVNNCFVDASKDEKNKAIELYDSLLSNCDDKKIKALLLDSSVVLASKGIWVILTDKIKYEDINNNHLLVEKEFKKQEKIEIKIVALDEKIWKKLSTQFIEDKKAGKKYSYIEENQKDIENFATNLFNSDKIEFN